MTHDLFCIKGKVVVLTGGCGILGTAMSRYLARQGAKVAILDRVREKGEALAAGIRAEGGSAAYFDTDVLDKTILEQNRFDILKAFGKIDVLVNAAGGNMAGATIAPDRNIFDLEIDAFRQVVDLNLFGTVIPTMVFAESMVENGAGNIVNIASESALRPLTRVAGYGAAKAAVANFTKYMCGEMATKFGADFRVNALAPGFFITDQNRDLLIDKDGSYTDRAKSILAHTPYGRFGEADELLGSLHYLISDASRFVSGAILVIDGGFDAFSI